MYKSTRGLGRIALYGTVVAAMLVSTLSSAVGVHTAAAQGTSRTINGHVVNGRFLEVWSSQGSEQNNVYVNGLPITDARNEISTENGKTYSTQWFERARYEAHPENKAPYDVLLGRLGASLSEGRPSMDPATGKPRNAADQPFVKVDKPSDLSATKLWFPESGHTISGKILEYWNKYGGLSQFGYPLSEQFPEISPTDGKTYTVQYFERNRFELHPEKQAPYEVELGLLGVQQYKTTPVAAADLPIAPPKGITSSKDTYTGATAQEPGSLFLMEEGTVTAVRHTWPITFNDGLIGQTDKETFFPLAAWYVPTLENGGAYFTGSGDDRHLVVKYKIRPGIKWSDGVELTSADAVFFYSFALKDPNYGSQVYYLKLSSVDNPDKYTVIYNYLSVNQAKAIMADPKSDKTQYDFLKVNINKDRPVVDPVFPYFAIGNVFPQHVLSKIDPTKVQDSSFARAPIGYGPYVVDHWTSGVEMQFKPNTNYNLTDPPLLKNIIIKEGVALDSAYQQIAAGTIDDVSGEAILVPPPNAADLQSKGVNVISIPAESWEHLDFYFNYGPFKDKAVRQAIAQAVNKDRVISVVYKGKATAMNSVVPPLSKYSLDNPDYAKTYPDLAAKYKLATYKYDPAAANKLLDDAGWVKGSDGIRAKGGEKLSFEYASTNNPTRIQIMTLIQDDLKQVGIQANLKNYTAGEYFDGQGPIALGTCKICQFAYDQTSFNDFLAWESSQVWTPTFNGGNKQQYKNPQLDAANQDFDSSVADKDIADASARAQMVLADDVAVVPLITRLHIELIRNNFMNYKETINSSPQTWNITQWYFK
jgi:peptide/nickel transport system substrate-binding protein